MIGSKLRQPPLIKFLIESRFLLILPRSVICYGQTTERTERFGTVRASNTVGRLYHVGKKPFGIGIAALSAEEDAKIAFRAQRFDIVWTKGTFLFLDGVAVQFFGFGEVGLVFQKLGEQTLRGECLPIIGANNATLHRNGFFDQLLRRLVESE